MRSRRSLTAVLVSVFVLAFMPPTTAVAAPLAPTHYVALGDSYTSGPLIPFQRLDQIGCLRSTNNYPSVVARRRSSLVAPSASGGGASVTAVSLARRGDTRNGHPSPRRPLPVPVGRNQGGP